MVKILLLSAYDAPSHQRWRQGLVNNLPDIDWHVLALPARFFSWRIRGNPLSWWGDHYSVLSQEFDAIIATSMVDLSTLVGLFPSLSSVPRLLYFHENQLAYPVSSTQHKSVEPAMVSIYAAMCATRLCFNSEYNRKSFLNGVTALLAKMPDHVPLGLVDHLASKSQVLAVPLEDDCFTLAARFSPTAIQRERGTILWNHRWEYDKSPERLLAVIQHLPAHLPLTFHVVGQRFRQQPKEFELIHALLVKRKWLGCWGYVDSLSEYRKLLRRSHLVLSTAIHDFQGLSILEAVAAGAVPIVPDRLAYQELFPVAYRYASESCFSEQKQSKHVSENNKVTLADEIASCVDAIVRQIEATEIDEGYAPRVDSLAWSNMGVTYKNVISNLVCKL